MKNTTRSQEYRCNISIEIKQTWCVNWNDKFKNKKFKKPNKASFRDNCKIS